MSFAGRRGPKVLCDKEGVGGAGGKRRKKNRGGWGGCIQFALHIFTTFGSGTFAL